MKLEKRPLVVAMYSMLVLVVFLPGVLSAVAQESELSEERKSQLIKRFPKSDANKDGKLDDAELRALQDFFEARRNNAPRNKTPSTPTSDAKPHADTDKWKTVGLQQANTMGGGEAAIPKSGKFRVFVLMGQSNMHGTGRAKELKAPYTHKHDRIRIWANGRWEYLVPSQRFGPGVSFAHQLAAFWPNDTIGIIKVSSGGTGIRGFEKKWSFERANLTFDGKKGSLYKDLMNAVAEAKRISKPEFCGFFWKQGAADGTKKVLANDYYDTFKLLVSDLRADLGDPDLPVFVPAYMNDEDLLKAAMSNMSDEDLSRIKNPAGKPEVKKDELLQAVLNYLNELSFSKLRKMSGKRPYMMEVIASQNRAGREIHNVATIYPGELPKGADGTHYSAEGYITLGKFTASAVQEFYKENTSAAVDRHSHGVTQDQLESLSDIMRQAVKQQQIAGCSFQVVHKGKTVFREAFGYADIESKRPFTTDELLPIASVSKPFMASVVMALVDQGKLNLDDPVEKYLPKFKGIKVEGNQSPARPMTIRHLLSHTAGFWGNKGITPEKTDLIRNFERPLAETIELVAEYDLVYEPGTKWIYSGVGYCVLGRVAEVALGQSLEEIARDALFRPLGLNNTTFLPSKEARKTVPTGYLKKGGKLQKQPSLAQIEELRFILPGGSLFTTLDELAALGQMHLNDGVYNGKRILSEASVTEMRRLQSPDRPQRTYGLGWFRGDVSEYGLADQVFHGGALGAHFRIDRSREVVCVFLVHQTAVQVQDLKNKLVEQVNEMFPVSKSRADAPAPTGNNAIKQQILKLFPQADTNKDGVISDAEEAVVSRRALKRYPKADRDGDGVLSDAEKQALLRTAGRGELEY